MMFDPSAQMNPWMGGAFGTSQPFGTSWQQFPFQGYGFGQPSPFQQLQFGSPQFTSPQFGQGGLGQLAPQTWFGNPFGIGQQSYYPPSLQAVQQIPQLVHYAQQIAQQIPQLIPQIPQILQQNPQLLQQAPQLQQIPQVLHQAALLAQQLPHVLQALVSSQTQTGALGATPFMSGGGYRPGGFGPTPFS
jgi:hypothetical protein